MKKLCFFLFCLTIFLSSQGSLSYIYYSVNQGLSNNCVDAIVQDKDGYMWFGTRDGLNRFDGYSFKVFRITDFISNRKLTSECNYIRSLLEVPDSSQIWVGTNLGIFIFDKKSESFIDFIPESHDGTLVTKEVSSMVEDHSGNIWIVSSGQGIFKYEKAKKHLKFYRRAQPNEIAPGTIITDHSWTLCVDDYDVVWATTFKSGICRFDPTEDRFIFHPIDVNSDAVVKFYSMKYDSHEKCIWLGSLTSGLYKFDVKKYTWEKPDSRINGHEIDLIHGFAKISLHDMLIGSKEGVLHFNLATSECEHLDKSKSPSNLNMQAVIALYIDREGGIWLGTEYSGVMYLYPQINAVMHYDLPNAEQPTIMGKVVSGFAPRSDGKIWVGSHDCGVSLFDPLSQNIESFNHPLIQRDANCLFDDGTSLWLGYINNGLARIDYNNGGKTEQFHAQNELSFNISRASIASDLNDLSVLDLDASTISHNTIFSIFKSRKGRFFVGTQYGLNEYDEQKNRFKLWLWSANMQINDILEDDMDRLWFATKKDGIICYNLSNGKLIQYRKDLKSNSLPNDFVTCLFQDRQNRIWAGTMGNGLCLLDEASQTFRVFGKAEGMPSGIISSIEVDQMGNLWIGTARALVQLSPSFQIRCFDDNSGLQSKMFNDRASYFDDQKQLLYEGGINGFNVISPNLLSDNDILPIVGVSQVYLDNKSADLFPDGKELIQSIVDGKTLVVKASHKSIGFDLTAMSYVVPLQNRYAYRMVNFDEQWNEIQGRAHVSYNLPSGKYELCIRATNNSGLWGDEEFRLPIRVLPPVWRSLPLLLLYLLVTATITIWAVRKIRQGRSRRRHLKNLRAEIAKENELYNMKIQFLTNIAHDIRILLSLIVAPLEVAIKNCGQNTLVRENLETIQRNSDRLNALANQIMDFNKIGRDEFYFNFEMGDIVQCVEQTAKQFSQTLALKNIKFVVNIPDEAVLCRIDKESIMKALYNLLGNAMKYAKDSITLNLSASDKNIHIELINNGEPIAPEFKSKIFLPFYQVKESGANKNKGGSGIGLTIVKYVIDKHNGQIEVHSDSHKTAFVVDIPRVEQDVVEVQNEPQKVEEENNHQDLKEPSRQTLLVVEDEMELLRFIAKNMADKYNVYTACNGKEAVKVLESQKINLILTDVMMEEMDGLELCQYVRATPILCHIPVIMLTAKTDVASKISGVEKGADLYIEKPFSMALLQSQVSALLQNRELINQMYQKNIFLPPQSVAENMDDVRFLEKLNSLIDEHIDMSDGLIELLADKMSMSRSNMHKKIKKLSDMTPNDYIQLIRLKKAADLLCTTNYKINEISSMTGFNTPSYFSKCFFNRFGILPKDFVRDKHHASN